MVSFLHTADWQLGQTFRMVGPVKAKQLRSARLKTVTNLLELGQNLNVDFIVSAGDNFESNQVGGELLEETKHVLNEFPDIPIYVIPGNHDPLMEDYAFESKAMKSTGDHVHVLKEEEPIEVPGTSAVLYPGICRKKRSSNSPLSWVPPRQKPNRIRIGLAHGTWKVLPDLPEDDYPIEEGAADEKGLDYLALGHWHSTFPDPAKSSKHTYYSGTPEPTGFTETDSGNALIVEIDTPGSTPRVEKRRVAKYRWLERERNLSDEASLDGLEAELLAGDIERNRALLRLKPEGTVSLEIHEKFKQLAEKLNESFYFTDIQDEDLILTPEEGEINELTSGTGWLKGAINYLEELASGDISSPPENWKMDKPPSAEEAQRALELIYGRIRNEED